MKYKDFNMIIKEYEKMAEKSVRDGKPEYAEMCYVIIEDLKLLFKRGNSNCDKRGWDVEE